MTELVTLWTLQDVSDWEEMQKSGILQRSSGFIPDPGFADSYNWMMEQMNLRIPNYTGRSPIWAWYQPKPDLRIYAWGIPAGEQNVRIEFHAERSTILLSDFDAWHAVLNNWYLPTTQAEEDSLRYSEEEKRESWQHIFDLELLANSPLWGPEGTQYIQAVIEKVAIDQVVRVTPFMGRSPSANYSL